MEFIRNFIKNTLKNSKKIGLATLTSLFVITAVQATQIVKNQPQSYYSVLLSNMGYYLKHGSIGLKNLLIALFLEDEENNNEPQQIKAKKSVNIVPQHNNKPIVKNISQVKPAKKNNNIPQNIKKNIVKKSLSRKKNRSVHGDSSLGTQDACEETEYIVRGYLRKAGCPTADTVSVKKLRDDYPNHVGGVTNSYGIWIREGKQYQDSTNLNYTCAHEAGHWYYKHGSSNLPTFKKEFQADEFALNLLTQEEQKTLAARSAYALCNGKIKDGRINLLKPHTLKKNNVIEYYFILPGIDHAKNILNILPQYKNILS